MNPSKKKGINLKKKNQKILSTRFNGSKTGSSPGPSVEQAPSENNRGGKRGGIGDHSRQKKARRVTRGKALGPRLRSSYSRKKRGGDPTIERRGT